MVIISRLEANMNREQRRAQQRVHKRAKRHFDKLKTDVQQQVDKDLYFKVKEINKKIEEEQDNGNTDQEN